MVIDYNLKLQTFVERLTTDMKQSLKTKGYLSQVDDCYAYFESGRKYDKILVSHAGGKSVRYFVDRKDGAVYGARSRLAPNMKWYFGTVDTQDKWWWGDFHAIPLEGANVIVVGQYAGYTRYMPV